jgi:hypothetical protein
MKMNWDIKLKITKKSPNWIDRRNQDQWKSDQFDVSQRIFRRTILFN